MGTGRVIYRGMAILMPQNWGTSRRKKQSTLSVHGQTGFAPWPKGVESIAKKRSWRHYGLVLASIHRCLGVNS